MWRYFYTVFCVPVDMGSHAPISMEQMSLYQKSYLVSAFEKSKIDVHVFLLHFKMVKNSKTLKKRALKTNMIGIQIRVHKNKYSILLLRQMQFI